MQIDRNESMAIETTPENEGIIIPHLMGALELLAKLQSLGIDPILYGSTGASRYLGQFKPKFGDYDFLVPDTLVREDWPQLQELLASIGYTLIDEHEHEFIDADGQRVQFGKESLLTSDKVLESLDEVITVPIGGLRVRTLTAEGFKSAYEFSIKDGYRRDTGKKDDASVIALLDAYIEGKNAYL